MPQTIPAGNVYVAYTAFTGTGATEQSEIMFTRSIDCGQTWNAPTSLSTGSRLVQNAQIAVSPTNGHVYVSWRRFRWDVAGRRDHGRALDRRRRHVQQAGARGRRTPVRSGVARTTSFRTNGFQTMAVDARWARVLAWTERGHAPGCGRTRSNGDARDRHVDVDQRHDVDVPCAIQPAGLGHQVMPALTFHAGKLRLLYYDLREDVSEIFGPFVDEGRSSRLAGSPVRHTVDVFVAQALPGAAPVFTTARLSDYAYGFCRARKSPIACSSIRRTCRCSGPGTTPFMGDYIDLAPAPAFVQNPDGSWAHNIAPSDSAMSHAFWTDNRDVRPPPDDDWVNYTPVTVADAPAVE